jgi:hypothetical protein
MDGDINVYFLEGTIEGENGWHFFVGCSKEIPTEKYVKFCKCLQTALDVLNGKEDKK